MTHTATMLAASNAAARSGAEYRPQTAAFLLPIPTLPSMYWHKGVSRNANAAHAITVKLMNNLECCGFKVQGQQHAKRNILDLNSTLGRYDKNDSMSEVLDYALND